MRGLLSFPQGGTPETFLVKDGIDSCLYGIRACALLEHIFVFMRRFMSGMGRKLATKFIQVLSDNGYATNMTAVRSLLSKTSKRAISRKNIW